MARRPRLPPPSDYRRLTPAELRRLGYGAGSKRRVLDTVKRVTKRTASISDRQYAQLQLQERFGKKTTKESYRSLIVHGKAKYATRQAKSASEARFIRQHIKDIAPRHLDVILKWYANGGGGGSGWNSLSPREQDTFRSIFTQYPRDDVRQALGSAPQDVGAFAIG